MLIIRKGMASIAFIDPAKKPREAGQFTHFSAEQLAGRDIALLVAEYTAKRFEIRIYFKEIRTQEGVKVPAKVIITYMPAGHVQPFHWHEDLYEVITVDESEVIAIDHPSLQETDIEEIRRLGTILREGDMVVQSTGTRHTIANLSNGYARTTCVQTPITSYEDSFGDWKR